MQVGKSGTFIRIQGTSGNVNGPGTVVRVAFLCGAMQEMNGLWPRVALGFVAAL